MKRGLAVSRMLATLVVATGLSAQSVGAQQAPTRIDTTAALRGVVHDTTGAVLENAEVLLRTAGVSVRTDRAGQFTVASIAPGTYDVWVRRIGYASIRYRWTALPGATTQLTIALHAIAHDLDPMIVRANEDRFVDATSSIIGVLLDSTGAPVEEAEVQLVGADQTAVSRSDGRFLIEPVPTGEYALRIRKLGFAPIVRQVSIQPGEQHQIAFRLTRLPAMLDPFVINEQSGFGSTQIVWDELDRRLRLRTPEDVVLGPAELAQYQSLPLDAASPFMLASAVGATNATTLRPVSIVSSPRRTLPPIEGEACILLNGSTALYEPRRLFAASDLQLVEIYPSGSELTETVAARMDTKRDCRAEGLRHPTYYVLWLKGNK